MAFDPRLRDHHLIAYDAPGCGESTIDLPHNLSIPFLVQTAKQMLALSGIKRFHLAGHSMGGLTALKLAEELGPSVISFSNIEGNIAPEDCFLSRQILQYPAADAEEFFQAFRERIQNAPGTSNALYAANLPKKVRANSVAPIFRSMVDLSDNTPLFDIFTNLPCAKMLIYGEENQTLSYLNTLIERGVQLAEIEGSGHFPMYANPKALWTRLAQFISQTDKNP